MKRASAGSGRDRKNDDSAIWVGNLFNVYTKLKGLKQFMRHANRVIDCLAADDDAWWLVLNAKYEMPATLIANCNAVLAEIPIIKLSLSFLELQMCRL